MSEPLSRMTVESVATISSRPQWIFVTGVLTGVPVSIGDLISVGNGNEMLSTTIESIEIHSPLGKTTLVLNSSLKAVTTPGTVITRDSWRRLVVRGLCGRRTRWHWLQRCRSERRQPNSRSGVECVSNRLARDERRYLSVTTEPQVTLLPDRRFRCSPQDGEKFSLRVALRIRGIQLLQKEFQLV